MAHEQENGNAPEKEKTQVSLRMDSAVIAAVSQLADEEDRSFTNMAERLLKTHPSIQPIYDAATAEVSA